MERKKGAQPGNFNALKHGLYSKSLTRSEKLQLQKSDSAHGLDVEIALLRLKISQLIKRDPRNLQLLLHACTTLGRLERVRYSCPQKDKDLKQAFRNVLREAAFSMGMKLDEELVG